MNAKRKLPLAQFAARLDALSVKERVLIASSLLLSVALGWQSLLIDPLVARKQALLAEVAGANDALQKLETLSRDLMVAAQVDPDAPSRQRLVTRERELEALRARVAAKVGDVVPPAQMAKVLETVLGRFRDLEFVGLEGLGAEPLVRSETEEAARAPAQVRGTQSASRDTKTDTPLVAAPEGRATAYRHGIRIRFAGSYVATVNYLRALEALPWGFFWDRVELETQDFPRVEGSIVVYTVSLDRGWIGV